MRLTRPYRDADANAAIRDLATIAGHLADLLPAARRNLKGWSTALRSSDSAGRSHGGSPTEAAAIAATSGSKVDEAGDALLDLDRTLRTAHDLLRMLEANARRWTDTNPPVQPEGCLLCESHGDTWQAIYTRTTDPTGRKTARCSFHHEWLERYDEDAVQPITIWHLANPGKRVPQALIRLHHPQAYARHHYLQGQYRGITNPDPQTTPR